jgi:hypothetical protein
MKATYRLAAAVIIALGVAATSAARLTPHKATKISGSSKLTYSEQHALPVPAASGYQLLAGETRGVNQNTGQSDWMSDAKVTNVETANLAKGNGTHEGYYTMSKGRDTLTAKWSGKVTTTMANNQPSTSFKGNWEYVYGTGSYAGVKGKGTYKGQFLAKDRYAVEWEGEYSK